MVCGGICLAFSLCFPVALCKRVYHPYSKNYALPSSPKAVIYCIKVGSSSLLAVAYCSVSPDRAMEVEEGSALLWK